MAKALRIVAVIAVILGHASARAQPTAEFGAPPVGAVFVFSSEERTFERTIVSVEGGEITHRDRDGEKHHYYRHFIKRYPTFIIDEKSMDALWPLAVGKRVTFQTSRSLGTWTYVYEVLRYESISVRAGNFDAFVVEETEKATIGTFERKALAWYAPEINFIVKATSRVVRGISGRSFDVELDSYKLPGILPTAEPAVRKVASHIPQQIASFDGDWVLEIVEPTYIPKGVKVNTKIADKKFSAVFSGGGWHGEISGRIDTTSRWGDAPGTLFANGYAMNTVWKGQWARQEDATVLIKFSTDYVDGLFQHSVEGGSGTDIEFRITLTPISPLPLSGAAVAAPEKAPASVQAPGTDVEGSRTIADRLQEVKDLLDSGLITSEEAADKRKAILDEL